MLTKCLKFSVVEMESFSFLVKRAHENVAVRLSCFFIIFRGVKRDQIVKAAQQLLSPVVAAGLEFLNIRSRRH